MIPFNKPNLDNKEEEAAIRVIKSGHMTAGQEVLQFEKEFAEFLNAPYVVAVDSCTNALYLALHYERMTKGPKEVGCPGMTFASVAHCIVQNDLGLTFVDEYHAGEGYQLRNTDIWDMAHQIERGMYKAGQIQCFSFYPNKVLSSCEGGAIATDNAEFAEWARQAREMGRVRRSFSDYDINFAGWKMNMTDMQAAIAREQLKKLDGFNKRRAEIKKMYDAELHDYRFDRYPYLYIIEVKDRKSFIENMAKEGVEISYHYKPLYEQPAYADLKTDYYYLDSIKDTVVTLPLYPSLTDEEVQKIIKLTKQYAA